MVRVLSAKPEFLNFKPDLPLAMSLVKIWIHCLWTTKNKKPMLEKNIRNQIFEHMGQKAKEKGYFIDCINGIDDHVHCLVSLKSVQNVARFLNLIKGESSHWINENRLTLSHFEWQEDYYAFSVCPSILGMTRSFIKNQEENHFEQTLDEEIRGLLDKLNKAF